MNTEILGVVAQIVLMIVLSYPLGKYMARVYKGEKVWSDFMQPVENLIFRFSGIHPQEEMNWKQFLKALLVVNLFWFIWGMILLVIQGSLPLNPDGNGGHTVEETDPQFVNFEFDSYWFTEGGANALAWMQRLGTRMKLWHINDRGTRISGSAVTPILKTDSMELGTGNMDLDSLMAQALTIGVDAVILESHRNWVDNSPIKSLQLSAEYLKQHG